MNRNKAGGWASLAAANATRRRLLEALLHEAPEPAKATLEAAE